MLVKVDRASMANSLEVRAFYLHPLIADFAFDLPVSDLVSLKHDKLFLKSFLEGKLPSANLFRRKMGFVFPLKELISGPLNSFFKKAIASIPEEFINKKGIERIMENHLKGDRNYAAQLNSLMVLGLWFKNNP
jgi:asparagine synthase (glutamine-hydrolysing)